MASLRPLTLIAVVLAPLALASPAAAKCASPDKLLQPVSGSEVSDDTTSLYLFVPIFGSKPRLEPEVRDQRGMRLAAELHELSASTDLVSYELFVQTGDATRIDVRIGSTHATYPVVPGDRLMDARPAYPTIAYAAEHLRSEWSCSHTDKRRIYLSGSPQPAYRVRYAPSLEAMRAANSEGVVLPSSSDRFWGTDPKGLASVDLGQLSCFGETVATAKVQGTLFVEITPLTAVGPLHTSQLFRVEQNAVFPVADPIVVAEPEPVADDGLRGVCGNGLDYERTVPTAKRMLGRGIGIALVLGILAGLALLLWIVLRFGPVLRRRL